MDIANTMKEAHKISKDNGFWEEGSHDIRKDLIAINGEISETFEAYRRDNTAKLKDANDYKRLSTTCFHAEAKKFYDTKIKGSLQEELADIVILTMSVIVGHDFQVNKDIMDNLNIHKADNVEDLCFMLIVDTANAMKSTEIGSSSIAYSLYRVFLTVLSYCEENDIEIEQFISAKMLYNKGRGYLHGRTRF